MLIRLTAIFLALAVPVLQAASPEADAKRWRTIAATLESQQTAASLSTAALIQISVGKNEAKALTLIDAAAVKGPTDPSIAWLALSICTQMQGCDPAARASRLRDLDEGNAVVHYAALVRASGSKDEAAEDRALAAMAGSGYFDVYWSKLLLTAVDTLVTPRGRKRPPLREIELATSDVVGWLASAAIPPFGAASDTCKGDRLLRDDVKAWCRKFVDVMENGDTFISQAIGRAIGMRVYSATDPQFALLEERKLHARYLTETVASQASGQRTAENASAWLNRFRVHHRESDAFRAWLVELGISPDPPADYASPK